MKRISSGVERKTERMKERKKNKCYSKNFHPHSFLFCRQHSTLARDIERNFFFFLKAILLLHVHGKRKKTENKNKKRKKKKEKRERRCAGENKSLKNTLVFKINFMHACV